jgi:BolA protein
MKERIEKKIRENLVVNFLEVKNNSYLHRGHLSDDGSGESHFSIIIESEDLQKIAKVQAHRKINQLLKDEFVNGMHALEIKIK